MARFQLGAFLTSAEASVLHVLGYGASGRVVRFYEYCAVRFVFTVPDMVPSLRHFSKDLDDRQLVEAHRPEDVVAALMKPYVRVVHEEREVRQWAFCDL